MTRTREIMDKRVVINYSSKIDTIVNLKRLHTSARSCANAHTHTQNSSHIHKLGIIFDVTEFMHSSVILPWERRLIIGSLLGGETGS